ncbi:PhzF family phenazine biosynthesis protein [Streptomyces collinus]|uniref:PhzF family phenazine biosynthesis protein n=1 Tax=Streptomyces collinus TaxID=42684 RepID=UPI0036627FF4
MVRISRPCGKAGSLWRIVPGGQVPQTCLKRVRWSGTAVGIEGCRVSGPSRPVRQCAAWEASGHDVVLARGRCSLWPGAGVSEDPACGSMNAAVGQWLTSTGAAPSAHPVSQGVWVGRAARTGVTADPDGTVWVSGAAVICIRCTITL